MQEIAMEPSAARRHWRGVALVAGAAAAWSIAGIITRLTETEAWTTLFWRSFFAATFLGCYIAFKERGDWRVVVKGFGWPSLGIAVRVAAAMICFILALHETTVANVLFIQATALCGPAPGGSGFRACCRRQRSRPAKGLGRGASSWTSREILRAGVVGRHTRFRGHGSQVWNCCK